MIRDAHGYKIDLNAPLSAVDAEIAHYCHQLSSSGLAFGRSEQITGTLIVYSIFDNSGWTKYGDCGRIFIKYLDHQTTRVQTEAQKPSQKDAANFASPTYLSNPNSAENELRSDDDLVRGYSTLLIHRTEFLQEICDTTSSRLANSSNTSNSTSSIPEKKLPESKGGRPGLADKDKIERIALAKLERRLKYKNPGLTRGEFVVWIREKLGFTMIASHTIKNAVKLLERAQENDEQNVLLEAEALADKWQNLYL